MEAALASLAGEEPAATEEPVATEEPAATEEAALASLAGGTALTVDSTVNDLIAIAEIKAILEEGWGGMYGAAVAQGGDTPFREVVNGFVDYGVFTQAEADALVAEVEAALASL